MRRARALGLAALFALGGATVWRPAAADPAVDASDSEHTLPELPKPPSVELGRPSAESLADVDALLGRIVGDNPDDRETAVRELLEAEPKQVSAIRFRIDSIADNADKEAMKKLLLDVRRAILRSESGNDDSADSDKPSTGPDYLARLMAAARPKSEAWRNLVNVLALSRMLESIGTVDAVRGLVEVYARFGEFLRINMQNAFARLGDRAVPALIEAERHPAEKIRKWAARQLDMLGRGVPGEAVRTEDQAVLADVLRAYGRTRDADAVRIVISFANSERAQVRDAARQAVALMGEISSWQLRDTYENVVGKKPPRDWGWERLARELFWQFDRLRFAHVEKLFDQGQAARKKGDLAAMRQSFDQLLAYDPSFDQQQELAAGYLAFAEANADQAPASALSAARRAERLDPSSKAARSLSLTLQAEALEDQGIADSTLLERALATDAQNGRAKADLARFERGEPKRSESSRLIAAGSILAAAAGAIALILLRRPRPQPEPSASPETDTSAETRPMTDTEPEPEPEPELDTEAKTTQEPDTESEPEPDTEAKTTQEPEPKTTLEAAAAPEPSVQRAVEPKPAESAPEAQPLPPEAEPKPTEPVPEAEAKPAELAPANSAARKGSDPNV